MKVIIADNQAHYFSLAKDRPKNTAILVEGTVEIMWDFFGDGGDGDEDVTKVRCSPKVAHALLSRYGCVLGYQTTYGVKTEDWDGNVQDLQCEQKNGTVGIVVIAEIEEVKNFLESV